MKTMPRPMIDARRRRAALLLEVLIALTIAVFAMGLMAGQLVGGLRLTYDADFQTRAVQLSDRLLALLELDMETAARFFSDQSIDGDFGEGNPGWFWRAYIEPLQDFEGLGRVTIEILYQTDEERIDHIEGATVVRSLHLLKADPGRIDLAEDFGVPEEQLALLSEMVPIPGFDPQSLDPQQLVSLDPATLLEMLPVLLPLLQQFGGIGGGGGMLGELLGGALPPGLEGLEGLMGGAGGEGGPQSEADRIRDAVRDATGEDLPPELLENIGGGQGGNRRGGAFRPPGRGQNINDLNNNRGGRGRGNRGGGEE